MKEDVSWLTFSFMRLWPVKENGHKENDTSSKEKSAFFKKSSKYFLNAYVLYVVLVPKTLCTNKKYRKVLLINEQKQCNSQSKQKTHRPRPTQKILRIHTQYILKTYTVNCRHIQVSLSMTRGYVLESVGYKEKT